MEDNKRKTTFWQDEMPLVSPRVKRMLSDPKTAAMLAESIRNVRRRQKAKYITQDDMDFLWSLMPDWVRNVPDEDDGWNPMFFGTLSRESDLMVHNRVKKLLNK